LVYSLLLNKIEEQIDSKIPSLYSQVKCLSAILGEKVKKYTNFFSFYSLVYTKLVKFDSRKNACSGFWLHILIALFYYLIVTLQQT
jgi:hypothetical protein